MAKRPSKRTPKGQTPDSPRSSPGGEPPEGGKRAGQSPASQGAGSPSVAERSGGVNPEGAPERPAFRVYGNSPDDPAVGRQVHINAVTSAVHYNGLVQRVGAKIEGIDLSVTSDAFVRGVFGKLGPLDPLEQMLVSQLILTHTRAVHLADLSMIQRDPEGIRITNEYADRAANTYRRLMLALAEYRRPPRGGDTHIRQANIAAQQVVLNAQGDGNANATNEQGYGTPEAPQRPQTLPALPEGSGIPPGIGGPHAALDTLHRPPDPRGQGPNPDERMAAR